MALLDVLDPLDLGGNKAADRSISAAEKNASTLRHFSDITQGNLQPFLDVANQSLPGLEAGASTGSFFDTANALRPLGESINRPIVEDRTRDLSSTLGASGLTRSGIAGTAAADIQEDADLSFLLQLQSMLTGRGQQVAGFGTNTGTNLARLGQQSAENLGAVQSQGILSAANSIGQGQQNAIGLVGLGTEFIPAGGGGAPINQQLANQSGIITPR